MLHGAWVSGGIKRKSLTASRGGVYRAGDEKWPRSGRVAELTGPGERHQKAAEMRRNEKEKRREKKKSQERETTKVGKTDKKTKQGRGERRKEKGKQERKGK